MRLRLHNLDVWIAITCHRLELATFDGSAEAWDTISMSNTPTRNISLTAELTAYIGAQVATGHFANASEVVRAGLRLMIERDRALTTAAGPDAQKTPGACETSDS